jgi:hypothetical protein
MHFVELKRIVLDFEEDGRIVENAKAAVPNLNVSSQLLELEMKYFSLSI